MINFDEKDFEREQKKHKRLSWISGVSGSIVGLIGIQFFGNRNQTIVLWVTAAFVVGILVNSMLKKVFHPELCHLREYLDYCEYRSMQDEEEVLDMEDK